MKARNGNYNLYRLHGRSNLGNSYKTEQIGLSLCHIFRLFCFSIHTGPLKFPSLLFRRSDWTSSVAEKDIRDNHNFQLHLNVTDPAEDKI